MATKTRPTREARIDMRLNPDDKALLEAAARLHGLNVSAYILSHSIPAARSEVGAAGTIGLSNRDRDLFLEKISSPPKPNKDLKKAMARYKSLNA